MTVSARPFLMFQGEASAALDLYLAVLPGAQVSAVEHWAAGEPGLEGRLKSARLILGDQEVMIFDSPARHAFTFTPSMSLFVTLADEAEIDRVSEALGESGSFLMPLGAYGFSRKFAWLNDRFGVSWQLNLP